MQICVLNHFGGINPTGTKLLHRIKERTKGTGAIDRTEYVQGGPSAWLPHWAERIAVATVRADARRALRRLPTIATRAADAKRAAFQAAMHALTTPPAPADSTAD